MLSARSLAMLTLSAFAGLAHAQVYATGSAQGGQNRYFSIDVTTGVATALASPLVPVQPVTTAGLAFAPNGTPYGIASGFLVQPDFANNTFTQIGSLGNLVFAGSLDILADGRAFTIQTNELTGLLAVDLATGGTVTIGSETELVDALVAAGANLSYFDPSIIIAMGSLGDTLYAIDSRSSSLVAINPATGQVTVPSGLAGQLRRGNLANGNARSRYATFAGLTGYDSNNDGTYDRLLGTVNTFDGVRLGALVEFNVTDGSWELIGTGNAPLNFFALGAPIGTQAGCDDIDFNNNEVFPEDQDIIDFFDVLAGGFCTPCNDIDFNNNQVFPEDQDIIDFFNVLAGGLCP
jgi:hypothetical protein